MEHNELNIHAEAHISVPTSDVGWKVSNRCNSEKYTQEVSFLFILPSSPY